MKLRLFIVYIFLLAYPAGAATPMSRVVAVTDSRTLVVDAAGRRSTVVLAGFVIDPIEEAAAAAYLHQLVDGTWLLIEKGNAYRSPDGLYVNGEMQRHAWRAVAGMRYLGMANPGPRQAQLRPATPTRAPARAGRSRTPAGAKRRKAPKAKGKS